ncbi:MAG TPA: copper homeostasis protein CutC [Planctomycetaceae bacterium]|nr:copper homeostasis protein CutC [Planctomycetaceae bacterium]
MRIEICVDSVEGALASERGGADRVELCGDLIEGGTTPSAGCIRLTRESIRIGLQVMIRPRGGDFCYSDLEFSVMQHDIRIAKELGADGVVIGCLTPAGDVDLPRTTELINLARPMNVTFHRAFDMCRDPRSALDDLIQAGADRVLTSGQEATCLEGLPLLSDLHRQAAGRIIVMACGGITARNIAGIVKATGVSEVHLAARCTIESRMTFRNDQCFMGGALHPPEFRWGGTDESLVRAAISAASS